MTYEKRVLAAIKRYRDRLSLQQYRTLRGQVLSGNPDAAMRGLLRIIASSEICINTGERP